MPSLPTVGQKPWDLNAWLLVGHDAAGNNLGAGSDATKVDKDSVVVAATRIFASKLLGTDTQPAVRLFGDGKIEWGGGGTTAPDTNLYRYAAGDLRTDNYFRAGQLTARYGGAGQVDVGANTTDARITFGSAGDINLYRQGPGILATDAAFCFDVSGLGYRMYMGSSFDTTLRRIAAGVVGVESILADQSSAGVGGGAFRGQQIAAQVLIRNKLLETDTYPAFYISGSGQLCWGAGGASPVDAILSRTTTNQISTNSSTHFYVGAAGATADLSGLLINVNGVGQRRIEVGAADSGGAGYKMLRIPN